MREMLQRIPKDSVYNVMSSPVGELWLIATDQGLHAVLWEEDLKNEKVREVLAKMKKSLDHPILKKTVNQLEQYFLGKRKQFDIPLVIDGTDFQKQVWHELAKIPYAGTISYQEQAKRIGDIKKARAVGAANGRNPISIIIPCHRVIAKSGSLTGFAGGLNTKKLLLELEQGSYS